MPNVRLTRMDEEEHHLVLSGIELKLLHPRLKVPIVLPDVQLVPMVDTYRVQEV